MASTAASSPAEASTSHPSVFRFGVDCVNKAADADGAGDLFASARAGAVRKGVSQIDDLGGTPPAVRPSPPREGQRKRRRLQPASTGNSEHYAIEL